MKEREFVAAYREIKAGAGGHSPSVTTLEARLGVSSVIDACYLSNPMATAVVEQRLKQAQSDDPLLLSKLIDRYPTPSSDLAEWLVDVARVPRENLLVCNGAAEAIPLLLAANPGKLLIATPTFSPYYEFAAGEVIQYQTLEESSALRAEGYLDLARQHRPAVAVVINPNNPDGFAFKPTHLRQLVAELSELCGHVIVDESFAGLAFPEPISTCAGLAITHDNVSVIRSLSKEYGIAGLRLGYVVMQEDRVRTAYQQGYLWNLNCFGEFFLRQLSDEGFVRDLNDAAMVYREVCADFMPQLRELPSSFIVPSRVNFGLLRLDGSMDAIDFTARLLFRYRVYVRSCEDKIGLSDRYLRVAVRTPEENVAILSALRGVLENGLR